MPLGTHYKEGAEYKIDMGTGFIIEGRVLAMPNCTSIAHARIEHWQADAQGYYVDKLRAYLLSDKDGGFSFKTEWPGARIPHIHFMVTAEGYKKLVTQWIGSKRVGQSRLELVLQPKEAPTSIDGSP
ncbi:MAG: hypothetical protein ACREXR_05410 [Gammaproteobacteria bacterium]